MKKHFLASLLMVLSFASFGQDITSGTWYNEEKTSRLQLFKQGNKLYGKIVWLKVTHENGKPRVDKENPDAKLKNTPLMGLVFVKGFEETSKNVWENGTVYDPKNGKTYSGKLTVVSSTQIDLRGFIGISLIGRTSKFTKAE